MMVLTYGGDRYRRRKWIKNGDGFLDYDSLPIHKTVPLVREIEKKRDASVMPVMVVYTANASGGSALGSSGRTAVTCKSTGNFITSVLQRSLEDDQHAVPGHLVR